MVNGSLGAEVDVTDADWQIPFVTYVLNTHAGWQRARKRVGGGDLGTLADSRNARQGGMKIGPFLTHFAMRMT